MGYILNLKLKFMFPIDGEINPISCFTLKICFCWQLERGAKGTTHALNGDKQREERVKKNESSHGVTGYFIQKYNWKILFITNMKPVYYILHHSTSLVGFLQPWGLVYALWLSNRHNRNNFYLLKLQYCMYQSSWSTKTSLLIKINHKGNL